jgi:AraC-like DNA-binding protein
MRRWIFIGVLLLCSHLIAASGVIIITDIPANTPADANLFLASDFNGWAPGNLNYTFRQASNGHWYYQLINPPPHFAFKITRGSWATVESDIRGQSIDNRHFKDVDTLRLSIEGWEDLPPEPPIGWLELAVTKIPENTPQDASIYATGSFNKWTTKDERYQLHLSADNTWRTKVPIWSDTIFYKFTRGSFDNVEGRSNGQARINRQFILSRHNSKVQYLEIESWEDLSARPINVYTLILLLAAIQGLLLILAINTLQDYNKAANRVLSVLIFLLSAAIIGKVSTYDRDIFNWLPRLLLLPDILLFLYAPLFFLYIQRLLHLPSALGGYGTRQWLHFLPFLIQLLIYMPWLIMPKQAFISSVVDLELKPFFAWVGGVALLLNLFYWIACQRYINRYKKTSDNTNSYNSNLEFLTVVMYLQLACLAIWTIIYITGGYGVFSGQDLSSITDVLVDSIWIVLSLSVFFLGYYSMRQPEIFKISIEDEQSTSDNISDVAEPGIKAEELSLLKEKIEAIMLEDKLYRNPGLTLNELAQKVGTNRHSLSRVINEGLGMNFNDFVNSYRVDEFKVLALDENYQNHTLLAIALIVGFNSKSAFNRSFKKLEQCTPREFLKRTENMA